MRLDARRALLVPMAALWGIAAVFGALVMRGQMARVGELGYSQLPYYLGVPLAVFLAVSAFVLLRRDSKLNALDWTVAGAVLLGLPAYIMSYTGGI